MTSSDNGDPVTPTVPPTSSSTPALVPETTATEPPQQTSTQAATSTPIPSTGAWRFSTSVDPINDEVTAIAVLEAETGQGTFGDPVLLIYRCRSNSTNDLWINWESYIDNEDVNLTSRLDDLPAHNQIWNISVDGTATFHPGTDSQIVNFIGDAESLAVRVQPFNDNPITAVFDVSAYQAAVERVMRDCGI